MKSFYPLAKLNEPVATMQVVDLRHATRVLIVGDVHGNFDLLRQELDRQDFNPQAGEHLLSVGDLVDRGPLSHEAEEWITQPWFWAVRGNHEVLAWDHSRGVPDGHLINGGQWFLGLTTAERRQAADAYMQLPTIMEVLCPSGRRIGVVHADYPTADWADAAEVLKTERGVTQCLWSRSRIDRISEGLQPAFTQIRGIDHVYHGHAIVDQVVTVGNCSWIDLGAYATGRMAVLDVDPRP